MVGDWELPGSPLAEILSQPDAESYAYNPNDKSWGVATEGHRLVQFGSQIPGMAVLEIVDLLCLGLISIVENSGEEDAVERLRKFVEGYQRLSQTNGLHACLHLGQALALLGELNGAIFFLDAVRSKNPRDTLLLSTSGRLLASQGRYKESADLFMAAVEQAIINDENPNSFVINAAGSLGQTGLILGVPAMLSSFGLDNSDIGACFKLVALARISDERRWEEWRAVRHLLLREAYPSPEKLRFALECAWYYGEKDLCIHRSSIMLLDPRMRLWTNKHLLVFFELMSQGANLNSLTVLDEIEWLATRWNLNNRRPEDLLSGLKLAAVKIWSYNEDISEIVSLFLAAAYNLQNQDWYDDLINMRSRCGICETRYRVESLGICTRCGGLFCFECEGSLRETGLPAGKCGCGGSIVG
jgi:tetratricopeptide (TPR) repeat protein